MDIDIDALARFAYEHGQSPIDHAIMLAETEIQVMQEIRTGRQTDPSTFPGYFLATDNRASATRIVGLLIEAGWTPPTVPDPLCQP